MTKMSESGIRERIAAAVRAALARDGRTCAKLAEAVGLSKSSLSKKLHARAPLYVDELIAITQALGLELVDILPRNGKDTAP